MVYDLEPIFIIMCIKHSEAAKSKAFGGQECRLWFKYLQYICIGYTCAMLYLDTYQISLKQTLYNLASKWHLWLWGKILWRIECVFQNIYNIFLKIPKANNFEDMERLVNDVKVQELDNIISDLPLSWDVRRQSVI